MRTVIEILGPVSKILQELGIDPYYPAYLLTPKLFTIAPKLARRLGDAS
jgi:vacuolar-type H+-ATPase catalytic subunit A/Vma1